MVNAVRQVVLTSSGNLSNSLNAALTHEIGRVLLVIRYINRFRHFANCSTDYVVICDNICPVILVEA